MEQVQAPSWYRACAMAQGMARWRYMTCAMAQGEVYFDLSQSQWNRFGTTSLLVCSGTSTTCANLFVSPGLSPM